MMTDVSKYLVQVLQFIIVLILAAQFSWNWMRRRRRARQAGVPAQPEAGGVEAAAMGRG